MHSRAKRSGMSVSELLVAATLLLTLITLVVPLAARTGRIWQDSRAYRMALEELTNELEHLTALPPEERQLALEQWQPSERITRALPGANLESETIDDEDGQRLVLTLDWDRPSGATPLSLVSWILPSSE